MKQLLFIVIVFFQLIINGCVTKFLPEIKDDQRLLVVEGLITDQPEVYSVKLSWSIPVGSEQKVRPISGWNVEVHDDLGNIYQYTESPDTGTYISDKETFQGVVGRIYTLYINTLGVSSSHHSFESIPVEMRAVPPIDSLFYEKVTIREGTESRGPVEGCQIYVNSYDPEGKCRFYRWDYSETWKFEIPYMVKNNVCWITTNSTKINIKNTSVLAEDRINCYPLNYITNESDRLSVRYSILVNQYSISEDEYSYWEKLHNITQEVGGLYDIMPSSVRGNVFCTEDPDLQVLGYFSVSSKTSERIYVDEIFRGPVNIYKDCEGESYPAGEFIPGLNVYRWIIFESNIYVTITYDKRCADCTTRGTLTQPDFWEEN